MINLSPSLRMMASLPRISNSHRLVAAILKKLDPAFDSHVLAYAKACAMTASFVQRLLHQPVGQIPRLPNIATHRLLEILLGANLCQLLLPRLFRHCHCDRH